MWCGPGFNPDSKSCYVEDLTRKLIWFFLKSKDKDEERAKISECLALSLEWTSYIRYIMQMKMLQTTGMLSKQLVNVGVRENYI